ncbi:MAG: type II CAAX prenyl endopeptidase Rce1 family protein [Chloroflexota bacterium]
MPDFIQFFLFVGFAGLMFLLRLDARRFAAAEWDTQEGDWRAWLPRLTWYAAGLALGLLVFALHPQPVSELNLSLAPDRGEALMLGLLYGAGGVVAAFALAIVVNGRIEFPRPGRYPGGVLAAVGTSFFDEFLFRGVVLGLLLSLDLPGWLAVVTAAFIYAGAIRASSAGRGLVMLLISITVGLVGGMLVLMTMGIAAAFFGHAITRFALFMTMGHREQTEPVGSKAASGGSADDNAYVIPPRNWPPGGDGNDGRGGFGPVARS